MSAVPHTIPKPLYATLNTARAPRSKPSCKPVRQAGKSPVTSHGAADLAPPPLSHAQRQQERAPTRVEDRTRDPGTPLTTPAQPSDPPTPHSSPENHGVGLTPAPRHHEPMTMTMLMQANHTQVEWAHDNATPRIT
ncbi:hypothetical protein BDZ97DRAFT_1924558 [Flammula alnicola]|nr:hypothetical protein BDZ97DRAFT_1924558 [Flammula alnicola]